MKSFLTLLCFLSILIFQSGCSNNRNPAGTQDKNQDKQQLESVNNPDGSDYFQRERHLGN